MRIHSLHYEDKAYQWKLTTVNFDKLTLLVGVSGVGKTQILRTILKLRSVTRGNSLNGISWGIKFSTVNKNEYIWEGEFENRGIEDERIFPDFLSYEDDEEGKDSFKIVSEKLFLNGTLIIERNQDVILFNGTETVKLSPDTSVLNLLKEEPQISPAYLGFQKILFNDNVDLGSLRIRLFDIDIIKNKYQTLKQIQESDESLRIKLYLTSLAAPSTFEQIKMRFMSVFPFVKDLKIMPISSSKVPAYLRDFPLIQIKEEGIKYWIDERQLSSGMSQTLLHITELYLCADGTVILVDEFENSLGVNCIDELTADLLGYDRELQFIITSHHPYIIDKISYNHWKMITRKAGVVTARDAKEFNLGKSKHTAFIQLINLDEYIDGVEL